MKKERSPQKPVEIPSPSKEPENPQPIDPEEPLIPEDDPDIIPEEDPFVSPPYEVPEPGEGP